MGRISPHFQGRDQINVLLVFFFVQLSSFAFANTQSITMACNDFAPLKIEKGPKDRPGRDIEILQSSLALSGIVVNTKFYPWKRALEMGESANINGLCSCSYTKEREKKFLFSDIMGKISIGIYTKKNTGIENFATIKKNSMVGVVRGYNLEDELVQKKIRTAVAATELSLLKMLELDRVVAVYAYKDVVDELALENKFINQFEYHEISSSFYYTCFSKNKIDSSQFVKNFNAGLKAIKKSGKYQEILKKYGH